MTSIKGRNSVTNMRKKMVYNLNLNLVNTVLMCIQNLVKLCPFVLKILSKKKILTSIKGRYSVTNLRKNVN